MLERFFVQPDSSSRARNPEKGDRGFKLGSLRHLKTGSGGYVGSKMTNRVKKRLDRVFGVCNDVNSARHHERERTGGL